MSSGIARLFRARVWAPATRHPGWGLLGALLVFFALTMVPFKPLRPWAVSEFETTSSGLLRLSPPSLFHSDWAPPFTELPAVRAARFSIAFSVVPERFDQGESSRILSYSADEANPIFMFSQKREHLLIEHNGQVTYLHDLFEPGVRHDYVVVLDGDGGIAYRDGARYAVGEFRGVPAPWRRGYVTVANEITGDRPFFGEVGQLVVVPRTLTPEQAVAFQPASPPPDALVLRHDEARQQLWFEADGARVALHRQAWPYVHKWRLGTQPYLSTFYLLRDVLINVLLTVPIGLFWALWRARRRSRSPIVALIGAGLLQLGCSVFVEASQFFSMGYRFPNGLDVLANTLGAGAGAWLATVLASVYAQRRTTTLPTE